MIHSLSLCRTLYIFALLTTNLRKVFYHFCHFITSKVRKVKELFLRHRTIDRTYMEAVLCFTQGSGCWTTILHTLTLPSEFPTDCEAHSVTHVLHSPPCKIATSLSICLIQHLKPMLLWDFFPLWISTVFTFLGSLTIFSRAPDMCKLLT